MALINKPHTFTAGTTKTGEASQVNADYDTIYAEFNGNIDDANVKALANIQQSKILNLSSDLQTIRHSFPTQLNIVQFLATGTYTRPSNLLFVRIIVIAGGGGGGGALSNTGSMAASGGGGGSGGYTESILLANQFGFVETVTVGAGGAGGNASPGNGQPGGNSAFGANIVYAGGGGPGLASVNLIGAPGAGGLIGSGNLPLPGTPGIAGFIGYLPTAAIAIAVGGTGGSISPYGAGGIAYPSLGAQAGQPGFRGGGGAGGASCDINAAVGGAGGDGTVIIYEYKYTP